MLQQSSEQGLGQPVGSLPKEAREQERQIIIGPNKNPLARGFPMQDRKRG